jgi:hypothetical protein
MKTMKGNKQLPAEPPPARRLVGLWMTRKEEL